jgi:hypothetical protein
MSHRIDPEDYTGERCPHCEADTLDIGEALPGTEQSLRLPVACTTCRATWTEHYGLLGYTDLEPPPPPLDQDPV